MATLTRTVQKRDLRREVLAVTESAQIAVEGIVDGLSRAQSILRDAVANLSGSFDGLRSTLEEQHALLLSITSSEGSGTGVAEVTRKLLKEFVDDVVRVSYGSMVVVDQLFTTAERMNAVTEGTKQLDRLVGDSHFIALNARIEAQRAGDSGLTFNVVANEMKRLASESSTLNIKIGKEVDACAAALRSSQDATQDLASHDLTTAIESNAALLRSLQNLEAVNHGIQACLERVSGSVGDAMRALQFEDMLTQLLGHTLTRVQEVSGLLTAALTTVSDDNDDNDARAELSEIAEALSTTNAGPVAQQSIDQGSVELF